MKRKTSANETRIWTIGCLIPPEETRKRLWDVAHLAHRYYNKLVEIESGRRELTFKLGRLEGPDLEAVKTADKAFQDRIAVRCAQNGYEPSDKGKFGPWAIASAKGDVLEAMLAEPEWSQAWKDRSRIQADAAKLVREARSQCGLPSATYLLVEKAFESARSKPGVPKFKRWTGLGRIGVIVRKVPATEMRDGTSSPIVFRPRSEDFLRGHAPRDDRKEVELRTGPGSETVRMACVVHRDLPPDAIATQAWIRVTRKGTREKFEVQLVLEAPSFESQPLDSSRPAVAIDLGWRRKSKGGVRAAFWVDSLGRCGEVAVPASVADGLSLCDSLQAANSKLFNRALELTRTWLKTNREKLPEDVRAQAAHAHSWKASRRLAHFASKVVEATCGREKALEIWRQWKEWRFSFTKRKDLMASYSTIRAWAKGAGIAVDPFVLYLEFWRHKNKHLFGWSESLRGRCLGFRDETFRIEAARMAREYGAIVFENFDLRAFARDALPDEDGSPDRHHRTRNTASPGRFRHFVTSAAGKNRVVDEEMMDSTRECHVCTFVNVSWEKPGNLEQECGGCGATWDQDHNAAAVLLKRHYERVRNGSPPAPARKASRPLKKRNEVAEPA